MHTVKLNQERAIAHPLAWGVIVPLALCLVTPLLVHSAFIFPFISTKTFWFRIWVEVALAVYVVLAVKAPLYRPTITPIFKAMGVYFIIVAASSLFGENPYKSFWGNIERGEGILTLSHVFLFSFLCAHVLRGRRIWEWFFAGSLFIAVAVSLYALGQYLGVPWVLHSGEKRLSGTIGNASFLAGYILIHTFIALWFILTPRARWMRIVAGTVWLFLLFIIFNTGTRGALLAGFAVYIGLAAWFAIRADGKMANRVRIAALSVGMTLVGAAVVVWQQRDAAWVQDNPTLVRLVTITPRDITTQSRLLTWESSLKGWKERPLLGYGYENYNVAFNKYFNPLIYKDIGSQIWFDRAHNVIFDILVTSGILGLIAYLAWYGFVCAVAFRSSRQNDPWMRVSGILVCGLVVAHFLQNFFVFDILATYVPLMLVFSFIDVLAHRSSPLAIAGSSVPVQPAGWSPFVAVLLAVAALYIFNVKPASVNIAGLVAMRLRFTEHYEEAHKAFLALEKRGTYQLPEIRTKLIELALEVRGKRGVSDEFAAQVVDDAIKLTLKNIEESPKDAQHYLYLMNLFFVGGKYDVERYPQIEKVGREALALSSTRPQIYYLLGQGAVARKEYGRAVEYFEKAVALNPAVLDSQWNLAIAYRFVNRKEEEKKVYAALESMGLSFDRRESLDEQGLLRLTQRYISFKEYDTLAQIFEVLVARSPSNSEYWENLAAAYKSSGQYDRARQAAVKVRELNPAAEAEIEKFLKEIEEEQSTLGENVK